jgi:hypothetical protein
MSVRQALKVDRPLVALVVVTIVLAVFGISLRMAYTSMKQPKAELAELVASALAHQISEIQTGVSEVQKNVHSLANNINKTAPELPSIWRGGHPCPHEKPPPPPLREWAVRDDKYLVAGCQIGGFSNRLEALLSGVRLAIALQRRLVIAPWKEVEESGVPLGADFDPLEVLDFELAGECAGPGRMVSWEEFRQVQKGLSMLGLCVYYPGGEGRCEEGERIGEATLGVPFRQLNVSGYDVRDIPAEMDYEEDVLWVSFFTPGETRASNFILFLLPCHGEGDRITVLAYDIKLQRR